MRKSGMKYVRSAFALCEEAMEMFSSGALNSALNEALNEALMRL